MKTRLIIIAILLLILTVLLSRNDDRIIDGLLSAINPIKQNYKNFMRNLEDKTHSYIFQKESIEKLSYENRILRKRLLEQMHYIEEVKNIYEILPGLSHLPVSAVSIVETISYVKLNSFSQVILTKPKDLTSDKLYGMIQNHVVAGIAHVKNNQLYGYLTSDKKCRFSVFIGDEKAPGIAIGKETNEMMIKFIPKWHQIKKGDKVFTSGLDNIFFADTPVGIVTKVEVQSSYTVAYIKTYSDIFHPETFFLITDAKRTLTENFDNNKTNIAHKSRTGFFENNKTNAYHTNSEPNSSNEYNSSKYLPYIPADINRTVPVVSSIPSRIDQTQDNLIQPEITEEHHTITKKLTRRKSTRRKYKRKYKRKHKTTTLDLF